MAPEPVIKTYEMRSEKTPRKKNRVKIIFWQFVILLVLSVVLAVVAKYYWLPKYFPHKTETAITKTETVGTVAPAPANMSVASPPPANPVQPPAETAKPAADPAINDRIDALKAQVDKINKQHNLLLAYFAARDLKESLNNADEFKTQLEFFSEIADDDANLNGKIDILRQASVSGIITREKLLADLKVLEQQQMSTANASFGGSVTGALNNLVRVSKIEGDVNATDYNSILKRAELNLSKQNLSTAELQNTIAEVSKLGKPADNFIKEANNLARIMEVTDFFVTYTKAKAIKADSAND